MTELRISENWPDYLWCTSRGMPSSNGTQDDYSDSPWNSLLNNWSPTPWSPSQNQRVPLENINHFGNYNSDSEGLIGQTMLSSNLNLGQSNPLLTQGLFPQTSPRRAEGDTPQSDENAQTTDNLIQVSAQIDPSLVSVLSLYKWYISITEQPSVRSVSLIQQHLVSEGTKHVVFSRKSINFFSIITLFLKSLKRLFNFLFSFFQTFLIF